MTSMMKSIKYFSVAIFGALLLASCGSGGGGGGGGGTDPVIEKGSYITQYYFENDSGSFIHNSSYDVSGEEKVGTVINAEIKTFVNFDFDTNNANNVLTATLVKGANSLAVYYKKYAATTNQIIGGDSFDVSVNLPIVSSKKAGIKFLSCSSDINPSLDGNDSEYEIVITGGKASFSLVDTSGNHLIKESADSISDGYSDLSLVREEGTFIFKVNNSAVLNVTDAEIASKTDALVSGFGSIVAYTNDGNQTARKDVSIKSGEIAFADLKSAVKAAVLSSTKYKNNLYLSTSNSFNYDVIDLDITSVGGCISDYATLSNRIDNAASIKDLLSACEGSFALRLRAFREYSDYCLKDTLHKIHYAYFMPRCEVDTTTSALDGSTLFANYNESDLRPYVPNAYKLRTWDSTNPGLLDKYSEELSNTSTIADLYKLSDKYTTDCIRALAYHDAEYYYWQEYNLHNQDTYSIWWFLYTFHGAQGAGFKYYGNVYKEEGFVWTNDFRLSSFFFNPDCEGGATTNELILGGLGTTINLQTIANRAYTVTLNTCGGTLATTEIATDSSQTVNLNSYIPTKAGYEFAGWYPSRTFKGNPVTAVGQGNTNSLTFYACWKLGGVVTDTSVVPASYISENQIFQRNKPIVISGTGVDGISVTVDFDGEQKSSTITGGKWSVTFDAKQASFDPKTLTIVGGDNTYVFHNILIGDVWLAAGQSNMEYQIAWLYGWGIEKVGEFGDLHNFDKIRIFRQFVSGDTASEASADNTQCNRWYIGVNTADFIACTAIGVVFANRIAEALNIPVGIISSNRGGSVIEEWLSPESLAICGSSLPENDLKNAEAADSRFYNSMTSKFVGGGLSIKGVLWYQGESNAHNTDIYEGQFAQLVAQYRSIFNDSNLPVICQQLVQYQWIDFTDMRNVQWECMEDMDNVYTSCGIDTGNVAGGPDEIHAPEKIKVGTRMANIALEKVYGVGSDSISYYPVSAEQVGNKVIVSFENSETLTGSAASFFKIKDSNGATHDVSGKIVNNTIEFEFSGTATEVLYAQQAYLGYITLYGGNGLPVAPFAISIN